MGSEGKFWSSVRSFLPYLDEEARHPRAIVRFTQTAANNEAVIDEPGLYSFSESAAEWLRADRPETA